MGSCDYNDNCNDNDKKNHNHNHSGAPWVKIWLSMDPRNFGSVRPPLYVSWGTISHFKHSARFGR